MATGTLDDRYLTWLYTQVTSVKSQKGPRAYWTLFRQLYSTEFVWFVPNDDNRAADGKALRLEWLAGSDDKMVDADWLELGCSFLELLIGLSRRLAFEANDDSAPWFWHLIGNLGLLGYNDACEFNAKDVEDITSAVIWRTYDRYGNGGLFPLRRSKNDQRQVEIWYQLGEYLLQDQ